MTAQLTLAQQAEIEVALIMAAKGALPLSERQLRRYEDLKARGIALTGAEHTELVELLRGMAARNNVSPEAAEAELRLWEKYGSKSDGMRPISNKQCTIERALAASYFSYSKGVEQPFEERGRKTITIEKYEQPADSGIEDDNDLERTQRRAGERNEAIGLPDSFINEDATPDGRLPLLDVFPAYISDVVWVFWEAIRVFDPNKQRLDDPHPLLSVIKLVARSRVRHGVAGLPHGLVRYGSRQIKDVPSRHAQLREIMEEGFQDAMRAADAAVDHFIRTSSHATDVAVLELFWPRPELEWKQAGSCAPRGDRAQTRPGSLSHYPADQAYSRIHPRTR